MTIRRLKTYTGETGYVYQYYFVGQRAALDDGPSVPATEYIFDVSTDRKTVFSVSVFLAPAVLSDFAAVRGRSLSDPEQYAAAKLRLLQAFDEIPDMLQHGRRLTISSEALLTLLDSIGID